MKKWEKYLTKTWIKKLVRKEYKKIKKKQSEKLDDVVDFIFQCILDSLREWNEVYIKDFWIFYWKKTWWLIWHSVLDKKVIWLDMKHRVSLKRWVKI